MRVGVHRGGRRRRRGSHAARLACRRGSPGVEAGEQDSGSARRGAHGAAVRGGRCGHVVRVRTRGPGRVEAARGSACWGVRVCVGRSGARRARRSGRGAGSTRWRAALQRAGEKGERRKRGEGGKEIGKRKKKKEKEKEKEKERERAHADGIRGRLQRPGRPRVPRRLIGRRTRSEEKKEDGTAVGFGCRVGKEFRGIRGLDRKDRTQ